VRRMVLLEIKL